MEEKRVIYDKVNITARALSIFIVLGLFMVALVTGYGYYLGNSGGNAIPAASHREKDSENDALLFEERENATPPEACPEETDGIFTLP